MSCSKISIAVGESEKQVSVSFSTSGCNDQSLEVSIGPGVTQELVAIINPDLLRALFAVSSGNARISFGEKSVAVMPRIPLFWYDGIGTLAEDAICSEICSLSVFNPGDESILFSLRASHVFPETPESNSEEEEIESEPA